jgi:hypothetical protein
MPSQLGTTSSPPSAGHLRNIEQPAAFNQAVLDFLRQHKDLAHEQAWADVGLSSP